MRAGSRQFGGRKVRLLVVATHPIQYQAPLYRLLASSEVVDLHVAFLSDFGLAPSFDPGFGKQLAFDVPLTDGYDHTFLQSGRTEQASWYSMPPLRLWSYLRGENYDVVLAPPYGLLSTWAICLAATMRGTPYLMRSDARIEADLARPPLRRWAKRQLLGPLLRRAGACLAIGTSNSAFYQSYGVRDLRIVRAPFSVDNAFFAREGTKGRAQRAAMLGGLGLDPELPTLCFAAKLQPHKRPLDALAALRRMATPANLVMIGDGPLRFAVEEAVAELPSARALGFVNQSAIGQWYGACDILVLPSDFEPWGLVINEAMAAGAVPVVSSEVGCGPDLVQPGGGVVFPVGDPTALAAELDSLLTDPSVLANARRVGEQAIKQHDLAETARGFEQAAVLAAAGTRRR